MGKSFFIVPSFLIVFMMLLNGNLHTHPYALEAVAKASGSLTTPPLPPNTALTHTETTLSVATEDLTKPVAPVIDSAKNRGGEIPARIIIPSIKLDTSIVSVGLNEKGEMDVPGGKTNNVGWYEDGTVPGDLGSAVLDAHVFAAFHRLRELKEGADVYVIDVGGDRLHFRVSNREVYPLRDVPASKLFEANDAKRLNLITCAGALTRDHSTYDHRLIVYTTLVEETNK